MTNKKIIITLIVASLLVALVAVLFFVDSQRTTIQYITLSSTTSVFELSEKDQLALEEQYKLDEKELAAGASANSSFSKALEKAIVELYQAYTHMLQMVEIFETQGTLHKSSDTLSKGYFELNTVATVEVFCHQFEKFAFHQFGKNFSVQWRTYINDLDCFMLKRNLKLGLPFPHLYFSSAVALNGFPIMSRPERYPQSFECAAHNFGYSDPVRGGDIPFG